MLKTEDISFENAIETHASAWTNIVKTNNINPSLLPGWMHCVTEAFNLTNQYRVFILQENSELIGIIPYFVKKETINGIAVNTLQFGGNLVSYHQELIANKHQQQLLLEHFFAYITKHLQWDLTIINNIWDDGLTHKALTSLNSHTLNLSPGESSPYLSLNGDWNTLIASKRRKFRYKVNKREQELVRNPDIESIWYSGSDSEKLTETILEIEKNSWKVRENMDISSKPVETHYYQQLLPYMVDRELLLANVLKINGTPAAYNLCYQHNGMIGQIKTSFNEEYKDFSPGAMIIEEAIRKYFAMGLKEFDFLGDIMPHKQTWTKKYRRHNTITIFNNTPKAFLINKLLLIKKTLKPLFKKIKLKQ